VRAPANGVVVFADIVPARGNALVLDHGAGVYSTYGHLDGFDVEEGAEVRAGQIIGRVGTTGFSTGPHLHWEVWVNGANVDPLEWTRRTFP
jgi:murein DD-endopeptidase MepM/ murein hydrolase activator NlpD